MIPASCFDHVVILIFVVVTLVYNKKFVQHCANEHTTQSSASFIFTFSFSHFPALRLKTETLNSITNFFVSIKGTFTECELATKRTTFHTHIYYV